MQLKTRVGVWITSNTTRILENCFDIRAVCTYCQEEPVDNSDSEFPSQSLHLNQTAVHIAEGGHFQGFLWSIHMSINLRYVISFCVLKKLDCIFIFSSMVFSRRITTVLISPRSSYWMIQMVPASWVLKLKRSVYSYCGGKLFIQLNICHIIKLHLFFIWKIT
jgi:hypothetical protein